MPRQRPGSVLALAILHLIGGGLGLILMICAGIGLVIQSSPGFGGGGRGSQDASQQMQRHLEQSISTYRAYQVGDVLTGVILAFMLLGAGIGLLMMQPWARYLSFVYAGFSIMRKLFELVYTLAIVWPVANAYMKGQLVQQLPPQGQAAFRAGFTGAFFGSLVFNAFFILYPVSVLIVLLLPSVARAFAPVRRRSRDDEDDEEDDRRDRPSRSRRRERDEEEDEEDERDRRRDRYYRRD